jgi:polyhydroxyalkanoate synthesis regulator phasin
MSIEKETLVLKERSLSVGKRLIYIALGALLAVVVLAGSYAAFAAPQGRGERGALMAEGGFMPMGRSGDISVMRGDDHAALAEALGTTTEALDAARQAAHEALVADAVAAGTLTQEQADALLQGERIGRFRHPLRGINQAAGQAAFAEALGISVEELQTAHSAVFNARIDAAVADGSLTQEEADLLKARRAVAGYVDHTAMATAMQEQYRAAIAQAVADGAITQAQADQMLENLPGMGMGRGHGFDGHGKRGGGRHGGGMPGGFGPGCNGMEAPVTPTSANDL